MKVKNILNFCINHDRLPLNFKLYLPFKIVYTSSRAGFMIIDSHFEKNEDFYNFPSKDSPLISYPDRDRDRVKLGADRLSLAKKSSCLGYL